MNLQQSSMSDLQPWPQSYFKGKKGKKKEKVTQNFITLEISSPTEFKILTIMLCGSIEMKN